MNINILFFSLHQRLEVELSEAQQLALCLDDRIHDNVTQASTLQQLTARSGFCFIP